MMMKTWIVPLCRTGGAEEVTIGKRGTFTIPLGWKLVSKWYITQQKKLVEDHSKLEKKATASCAIQTHTTQKNATLLMRINELV